MTVTTDKTDTVIKNIDSYIKQRKFKYKGEYFHQKIFHHAMSGMFIYIEEKRSGAIIIRLFAYHFLFKMQISRKFSWHTLGMYGVLISRICGEISSVILKLDDSAQIQIEDKEEWYPVIILK